MLRFVQGSETTEAVYTKLQSRLKSERAAVHSLRAAALRERCDRAEAALPASAMPLPIGVLGPVHAGASTLRIYVITTSMPLMRWQLLEELCHRRSPEDFLGGDQG